MYAHMDFLSTIAKEGNMKWISFILLLMNSLLAGDKPMTPFNQYLKGYTETIDGEELKYHSFIPEANKALLSRANEAVADISWLTEKIPAKMPGDSVTFIWIAGFSRDTSAKQFDFFFNEENIMTLTTGKEKDWSQKGKKGTFIRYKSMLKDDYGDNFGYLFLTVPRSLINLGEKQKMEIFGEHAQSNSWYMTFKYDFKVVSFQPRPVIIKENGKKYQIIRAMVNNLTHAKAVTFKLSTNDTIRKKLTNGYNSFKIRIPAVNTRESITITSIINDQYIEKSMNIEPVIYREFHILHHSHVDIGYTHIQSQVEQMQYENIKQALALIAKTQNYPEGSQFKWNVEVLWAVEAFLERATNEELENFRQAVASGHLGLQALYNNILTGLCSMAELHHLLDYANRLKKEYNVDIESAMITDVPGYSWGIVPALRNNNVRYLSSGPNNFDRIGGTLSVWGDKPFYWETPGGDQKILTWIAGKGYALFHGWSGGAMQRTGENKLLNYCQELTESNYPYEMVQLRYTVKSDNGPPDSKLSEFVQEWNDTHVSPKLIINTSEAMFKKFEQRNRDKLPTFRGDFTPYWEDGAFSTAKMTQLNRKTVEKLVQTQALSLILDQPFTQKHFSKAWRNAILYDEHTWGAHNSISDPDAPFVRNQWKNKKAFAQRADSLVNKLYTDILNQQSNSSQYIEIFNTSLQPRTDAVIIPNSLKSTGTVAVDKSGNRWPVQQLSNEDLVFIAENIPPLGSKIYQIKQDDQVNNTPAVRVTKKMLSSGDMDVKFNNKGNISELVFNGINLVNDNSNGLNEYYYIPGKDPEKARTKGKVTISVKEKGPVFSAIQVTSTPPGCYQMTQEIRLYNQLNRVKLINCLDKKAIREKESVHFNFPFYVKNGTLLLDIPGALIQPEVDQLEGANRNFISLDKGFHLANNSIGLTMTTVDAPLLEIGGMHAEINHWMKKLPDSQNLYSYALNNYWHTNYKADQEGKITFSYEITLHDKKSNKLVKRTNRNNCRPLPIRQSKGFETEKKPLLNIDSKDVMLEEIVRISRSQILARFYNAGASPQSFQINRGILSIKNCWIVPADGKKQKLSEVIQIAPNAYKTVIIET